MTILPKHRAPLFLRLIAAGKMIQGCLLMGISLGLFSIVHDDLDLLARSIVHHLHLSLDGYLARLIILKAGLATPDGIHLAGWVVLGYALLMLGEGIGLWLERAWAEYLVIVATGLFIPFEIAALATRLNWERAVVLAANVVVLTYVVRLVRRNRTKARAVTAAEGALFDRRARIENP